MFGKLKEIMDAKAKAEDMKKALESMTVEGESYSREVVVTATGSRKITSIQISDEVIAKGNKPEIENLVKTAVNDALEKADRLMAEEMRKVMPNIPGLGI